MEYARVTEMPEGLVGLGLQWPKQLWYRGKWDKKLFVKCMTIVGSRRMTDYGRRVIEKIMPRLVQDGWTIVSGFMYGVDQYVHQTCLDCGGKTIAVLGWGISNRIQGTGDRDLAEKIINTGGLLMSLWENQAGTLWTFPARDRVMAYLGQELIVVEAGIKSGSLITAEMAIKMKKTVWAVPGPITSSVSAGTNQLIADGKGKIWIGPGVRIQESEVSNPIIELIENQGLDASEIARRLGRSVSDVGAELTMLILKGNVEERVGKYYFLNTSC